MNVSIRLQLVLILIINNILGQNTSSLSYQFDQTTAFVNATIYIDYKTKIDLATLLVKNGKVVNVGKEVEIPAHAKVVDCKGKVLYPSFVDIFSDYGIGEVKSLAGNRPHYETTVKGAYNKNQAVKSEVEADKYFKHDAARAKALRDVGFGVVVTANSDGLYRGTSCTVFLADQPERDLIIDNATSLNLSLNKGSSSQEYPTSLMGAIALLRQTMYDSEWYKNNNGKVPYDISLEKINQFKHKPWIFDAGNALNALRAQQISKEFNHKSIIYTSTVAYQQIAEFKKNKAHLIVGLDFPEAYKISSPKDAELLSNIQLLEWYLAPYNMSLLTKNQIEYSITASRLKDLKDFTKNLKKVMETEIAETEVLKSLTYNPCTQLGLYDKLGSLHKGKYANFIIANSTLGSKDFKIYQNYVKGEKYEISNIQKDYAGTYKLKIHNYPELELKIAGNEDKPSVSVARIIIKDTLKIPVVYEIKGDELTLILTMSKLDSTVRHKVYLRSSGYDSLSFRGIASSISWNSDQDFEAIRVYDKGSPADTTQHTDKNPIINIPIPFSSYGRDSIPAYSNYIIRNATIWTGEEVFELKEHSVVIKDGAIIALETNVNPSKYFKGGGYVDLDATGKYLTAGIIDEHSHIALNGGVNEAGESVTSEVRIKDIINPNDINIYRQLAGGVTTAHLLHGSANCIGGQSALIRLKWGCYTDALLFPNNKPFIKFALGENVKQSNWGDKYVIRYPQTRMGVEQTIIDAFQRAQEYKRSKDKFSKKQPPNEISPKYDLELEAILEILEKKRFITCHSYSQSEINMLMKVAERYNIQVNTFTHVLEGYKIADKLKKHGAGASSFSDWWSFKAEVRDAIPQNAGLLTNAGVITAINSDDPEMGRRLNQEAAKSVKYGKLSHADAWRLVTLNPAKLLKIDDQVGSIKVGKMADLVIWSENPLSVYAKAEKVFIEGVRYFDLDENNKLMTNNKIIRDKILEELLNDRTTELKKQLPKPEKQHHYHCDSFETID